jgi:uncharacterized protein
MRALRRLALGALLAAASLNVLAYHHARAFTRFAPPGPRTPRPEQLSALQKLGVLARGARVPRPENRRSPADVGLAFETHVFPGWRGIPLEAWLVRPNDARGTVLLFHGHAASKDSQLREAKAFHEMGWNAILVDFHGSGGSGGNVTSIGFHEATDVAGAFEHARRLPPGGPIVLYGASMGAAAVLKAVADESLAVDALVLESPFDSLLQTVSHRFHTMGVPAFPSAHLLVFWGGYDQSFDGFAHRPLESAHRITRPTLLLGGEADRWVTPAETRAIYESLRGPKSLHLFAELGHVAFMRQRPDEWRAVIGGFLDRFLAKAVVSTCYPARAEWISRMSTASSHHSWSATGGAWPSLAASGSWATA